ncbi:MAG: hypothetical protein G01um101420_96 [Parcubacteria group bacterium Gr01-1014_20]|nr:MAG: hypothetical protein G01um101420_96 [Parcubacteria group bacterium Gr01-1014_20]
MPKIVVTEKHCLAQEEALARTKKLLDQVKAQYAGKVNDLHEEWRGNSGVFSFTVMGFSISGTLTVTARDVTVEGNLPFLAGGYKGRVEETIRTRAKQLLA